MRFFDWLRRKVAQAPEAEPLRRDLKPGTVFRYLYADHASVFAGIVPPRHPDTPTAWPGVLIYGESDPGPGDLLTAVEILWEPPCANT